MVLVSWLFWASWLIFDEQTSLDELTCIDELALPGELADLGELTCAILSPGPEKRPFSRDFLFLIYTRPYSRVRKVNSRECPPFLRS